MSRSRRSDESDLSRARWGDEGGALAELALILPMLAAVVFGVVDLGRAFSTKNRLANMAREAAFFAQYHPFDVTDSDCHPSPSIESVAWNEDPGLAGATVTVIEPESETELSSSCGTPAAPGTRLRIRVSRTLTLFTPFSGGSMTLAGEVEVVTQG